MFSREGETMKHTIDGKRLIRRAGLRLLIAGACAAICVMEFRSSEGDGLTIFVTGVAAFLLFSRAIDVLVEELTGVQILSAFPIVGLPVLIFGLSSKTGGLILFGAVYLLCMIPVILAQARRGGKYAKYSHQLGGEEMERQEQTQLAAEDALFDAVEQSAKDVPDRGE